MKEKKRFTIAYYKGEEFDRLKLQASHESVKGAVRWCQINYIPLDVVEITEWDTKEDLTPKVLGSCSLDEAHEKKIHSLAF